MQKIKNQIIRPIGFFDSGIGGTSIWKEIHALLPMEQTIFLADSKNAPYGLKSKDEIIRLSEKNTELLIRNNCKIIVVACNTATTNAIKQLRAKYPIPFIGIEPAIKPASLNSKSRAIGILATQGTLSSDLFLHTSSLYSKDIQVIEQEGNGIVELIEAGKIGSLEMRRLLKKYLKPMIEAEIDYLVLGCSHYPYLIPILKELLPPKVNIIDSGLAAAKQTKAVLKKQKLLNQKPSGKKHLFYTNGKKALLEHFIGKNHQIIVGDF